MPKKKPAKTKAVKNKFWIYCEGENTERDYLLGYINDIHSNSALIECIDIPSIKQNTPVSIVRRIVQDKKNARGTRLDSDKYWAVYDRESITKYSDSLHDSALQQAKSNNIDIALSNVCIELWILLHFEYTSASYDNCDELLRNSNIRSHLRSIGITSDHKSIRDIYSRIKDRVNTARQNAERLERYNAGCYAPNTKPFRMNPSTNLHKLLISIDEFLNG